MSTITDKRMERRGPRTRPKDKWARYRQKLRADNRCPRCGKTPDSKYVLCLSCREKKLSYYRPKRKRSKFVPGPIPSEWQKVLTKLCKRLAAIDVDLDEELICGIVWTFLRDGDSASEEELTNVVNWVHEVLLSTTILHEFLVGTMKAKVNRKGELLFRLAE